ncbi:MBL fold metallo-hydrolase [Halobacteriovorax sp. JY17]|uniref:MBL fold metallo-hydrolase n=1 Tax=Halobacteriovorax sp. JY17 TaxID=2014617 RepID=UPI000C695B98|nr:MBL fold metallo-hydrolase [Halobacteriovorax sp. JY17]PIK15537.1 MAG: Zn-dependent hydrolase [Halobacteriovorax sp. JY17]
MVFSKEISVRPLFEKESSTYTYIVYDNESLDGLIIDPVKETFERDLRIIKELGLKIHWTLETHLHADHVTSAYSFSKELGAKIGLSQRALVDCTAATCLNDEEVVKISKNLSFKFLETPGHTNCSASILVDNFLFSGDTLLIRGCGRTDFQEGSNESLYKSVREKLFTLSDETIVFPGHNYGGEFMTTIGEEKKYNPRLKLTNTLSDFSEIMDNLNLSYPAKIDIALPSNRLCGKEVNS